MILRTNSIALVGTSRTVKLERGLNVIIGPISTGKTSLMRLLEVLIGGSYQGITPEVDRSVSELAGHLTIGATSYSVIRPLVQSDTARVQIAGDGIAERLPAMRPDQSAPLTYGGWLLERLGLPVLRVPQAPTRPAESTFVPVSINDFTRYCRLRQDEIDVDVLGSSQPFRDIKRRYVFRILYGGYDSEVAGLQNELRLLQAELTQLEGGHTALERFLQGTAFENRAAIRHDLDATRERQAELARERARLAAPEHVTPEAVRLRARIAEQEQGLSDARTALARERRSAGQLDELANELQAQSIRLTKAIVAGQRFFDFVFIVCPRCGSEVGPNRAKEGICYLCLQEEPPAPRREDLIQEQDRVNAQIEETEDLIRAHESRARELELVVSALESERRELGQALDRQVRTFVSDEAEHLEALVREEARLLERSRRLEEYLGLFERLDAVLSRMSELQQRRVELETALERAEHLDSVTTSRLEGLERWFRRYVEALEIPRFGTDVRAAIDRNTYEPIVNGQKFPQLSAGVRVLVNIAHLLAHHRAALELGLPLPGLIMIDGIAKNIGTAGYDVTRIQDIWTSLMRLSDELGEQIQIIVAANDVPDRVAPYVRLTLSEDNRLIPISDLL